MKNFCIVNKNLILFCAFFAKTMKNMPHLFDFQPIMKHVPDRHSYLEKSQLTCNVPGIGQQKCSGQDDFHRHRWHGCALECFSLKSYRDADCDWVAPECCVCWVRCILRGGKRVRYGIRNRNRFESCARCKRLLGQGTTVTVASADRGFFARVPMLWKEKSTEKFSTERQGSDATQMLLPLSAERLFLLLLLRFLGKPQPFSLLFLFFARILRAAGRQAARHTHSVCFCFYPQLGPFFDFFEGASAWAHCSLIDDVVFWQRVCCHN